MARPTHRSTGAAADARPSASGPTARFRLVADHATALNHGAKSVALLDLPSRTYGVIQGSEQPGSEQFARAIQLLNGIADDINTRLKRRGVAGDVPPLEGMHHGLPGRSWSWTLRIGLPDEATAAEIDEALVAAARRWPGATPAVVQKPGRRCAQLLHTGADDRQVTVDRLVAAIAETGLTPQGRHIEIYVADPRLSNTEQLKVLIRQYAQ